MAEVSSPRAVAGPSTSPPPNCAICLGTCTNKCFSDTCMHEFCFTCLREWSKVKPECPLCKQHFNSIIHNIKSINEFEEYIVEPIVQTRPNMGGDDFLYLPTTVPPSRHFQFRTTFTVDPRGELAIQQMLLTHGLTNSSYSPNYSYNYRHRHRRDVSSSSFRRSVYARNMWVTAPPDITGRYRDISPNFYRDNPAAINRLVPWLNRELNALLSENTQQVMVLVDEILGHLNRHHIRGIFFKNRLREYLGSKTDHFIHEFYSFMKSPYDMVGYDRLAAYYPRSSFIHTIPSEENSSSSDSDITVVATTSGTTVAAPNPNPFHRPTLEVIEINSDSSRDSDVIIHEPPPPEVVDLVNTSDEDVINIDVIAAERDEFINQVDSGESDVKPVPQPKYSLPCIKNKKGKKTVKDKQYQEKNKKKRKKSSKHIYTTSESDEDSSSEVEYLKYVQQRKKQKSAKKLSTSKSRRYNTCNISSSDEGSDDDEPLSEKLRKLKESAVTTRKSKRKDKMKTYHKHKSQRRCSFTEEEEDNDKDNKRQLHESLAAKLRHRSEEEEEDKKDFCHQLPRKTNNFHSNTAAKTEPATPPSFSTTSLSAFEPPHRHHRDCHQQDTKYDSDKPLDFSMAAFAGPSYRSSDSPKIKKERYHLWYSRPCAYDSDSSSSSN